MKRDIWGKNPPQGTTPSIALINPKYDRNVGAVLRAASCFDVKQVWFTGNRVRFEEGKRLPREERMKGYEDVELFQYDYVFDVHQTATPIAIEVREGAEMLTTFEHPTNALYVFGPEDGGLQRNTLQHCHRIVTIPTRHCTNLAAAVYITLYDRMLKSGQFYKLEEERGFTEEALIMG